MATTTVQLVDQFGNVVGTTYEAVYGTSVLPDGTLRINRHGATEFFAPGRWAAAREEQ